jgi:tetratricopeptide (TPR) repeat protein
LTRLAGRIRSAAPDHPAAAELDARVLIETGRPREAIGRLESTVGTHPGDAALWVTYADALVRAGELDRAIAALDEARSPERAGDSAALRTAQARLLDAVGRTDEARDVLVDHLDRLRPEDRMAPWMSLGDLELAHGRPPDALRAYQQGVRLAPDDPQPRLVVLDLALTEPPGIDGTDDLVRESIEALDRIEGSRGTDVLLGRAMILIDRAGEGDDEAREANLAEAEALLRSARAQLLDTRYADILEGRLMELRGRPEAAVAAYERAERTQPGEAVESRLMSLYTRLGRDADLARLHRDRLSAEPGLDRFAAEASSRLGLAERAEALARRVVEGAPDDPSTRLWQAQLLNSLGKAEEARASLDQLVAERPDRLGPRLAQLAFLVGTGQRDQADSAVEAIIENVRDLERPQLVHAQCWHVAGRPDRASDAFERAVKHWPDDDRVVRAAADYFEATGNAVRAETILRESWAAHPSWRWAADALALLLSDHPSDIPTWREAWSLVAPVEGRTDTPEDLFARGVVLSRSPDSDQARDAPELLERLLEGLPSNLPAAARTREILVRIYLREKAPAKAVALALANVEQRPDARSIRLYVEALIASGDPDEADRQVDRLAASTDESARAAAPLLRARVLGARDRPAEAAAVIEEAIGPLLDRPDGEAIAREAVRDLLAMGQAASAGRVADRLARRWPGAAVVAATVSASQGRHEEAMERFRQAVATADAEGLREISRNLLGLAVASGSRPEILDQADAILAAAVARAPDDPKLLVRMAHLRHLQGRYEDEVALYRKALGLNPADRGFLNNLAWTLSEELRRPEEGLQWINEAFRVVPRSPRLLDTRGVILTRLGRHPDAIRDLEAATAATPSPTMLAHLARAYHAAGDTGHFRIARDRARRAGLAPERLEPGERAELVELLLDDRRAAPNARPN